MTCSPPLEHGLLVDYWAHACDAEAAARVEEHVFACDGCAARLAAIAELADGVASIGRRGALSLTVTASVVERWQEDGLTLRHYRLGPGEHVLCTVKPLDDYVLSWLRAEYRPGASVSVELSLGGHVLMRRDDCPVDLERGELIVATPADMLRPLGQVELVARVIQDGVPLGDYRFLHAPDRPD